MIYVSVVKYGSYEDTEEKKLYVGTDYNKAKEILEQFEFPDPYNNWGWIEHWEDGKEVKHEYIRE